MPLPALLIRDTALAALHSADLTNLVHLQSVGSILDGGWPEDAGDRSPRVIGHGGAALPRTAPWLSAQLVANPAVESAVEALLGPGCRLTSLAGNTALPGSGPQRLHVDAIWRHRSEAEARQAGQPWPLPTTSVVVNFSGVDQSSLNGATEVWPGSHNDVRWSVHSQSPLLVMSKPFLKDRVCVQGALHG